MDTVTPIDEEYTFDNDVSISQTDSDGIITYANRAFCDVSGYKANELIGKAHSIVRHPDMPDQVFSKMWQTIADGQAWNGLVKNMRKDGLYYWVDTEILPIKNENREITGYIAVRKEASRKDIKESEDLYSKILDIQTK